MGTKSILTHSRMSSFRRCPRQHYLRYELGLSKEKKRDFTNVGTAFHEILNARHREIEPQLGEIPDYDLAVTAAMIAVYDEVHPPFNIIETELMFSLPLVHQRTKRQSRVWKWAGVMDAIVWLDSGVMAMVERKTTGRDITPGGEYWQNVMRDQQISQYLSAARKLGWPVQTIIYDVIRRPQNRPKLATPMDKRKYRKSDGQLYAGQRETDEAPKEFAERIANIMREDPEKYFQRIEIPRLDQELDAAAEDQWMLQRMIRRAQLTGEWPRNPNSCTMPFRCQFLDICDNTDLEDVTPPGFIRSEDVHPELTAARSP